MGSNVKHLLSAWVVSAVAFSAAFVAWMFISVNLIEGSVLPKPVGILRLSVIALSACLIFQLLYGGLVYLGLTRTGLWSIWTVVLAYVTPVVLFSWSVSDTTQDLLGTIPWIVFALIIATMTWALVPVPGNS